MARTLSNMLPLGTVAPNFTLTDTVSGKNVSLADLKSEKATVVMFICNHCPYVIHVQDEILDIARNYGSQGVNFVAISANDVDNYPDDAPEKMKELALEKNYPFPYLYDESQEIAKAYDAACTPDFYVFDKNLKLTYRGRMDGSTPGNGVPVTGVDLRHAIESAISGKKIEESDQYPSMGCNIKWKS